MPCLSPYVKRNPNYGLQYIGLNYLKDCSSQMLSIPCGHCPSCIAVRQMYIVQRVQMEAFYNHLFMLTLTYNNEHLPHFIVGDYDIPYADMRDLVLMFKNIRADNVISRPFRYAAVSEFGGLKGRPHFHALIMLPRYESDTFSDCLNLQSELYPIFLHYWRKNVGSRSHPVYEPLCTYVRKIIRHRLRSNYDLHYVNPSLTSNGVSDAAFYVMKYMLKDSDRAVRLQQALHLNYDYSTYRSIWDTVKPKAQFSLGFGLNAKVTSNKPIKMDFDSRIIDYLHKCVVDTPSGSPYPFFFSPDSGLSFPLAPYYRKIPQVFSLMDAHDIFFNASDDFAPQKSSMVVEKQFNDFLTKRSLVQTDDYSDFLSDFYD